MSSMLGNSRPMSSGPILNWAATSRMTSKRVRLEGNFFSKILRDSSPRQQLLQTRSHTEEVGTWELWAFKDPTPKYSVARSKASASSNAPLADHQDPPPDRNSSTLSTTTPQYNFRNSARQTSPSCRKSLAKLVAISARSSQAPRRMPYRGELKIRYVSISMPWKRAVLSMVAWVAMVSTYSFLMGRRQERLRRMKVHRMQEKEKSFSPASVDNSSRSPSTSPSRNAFNISSNTSGHSTAYSMAYFPNPARRSLLRYLWRRFLRRQSRSSLRAALLATGIMRERKCMRSTMETASCSWWAILSLASVRLLKRVLNMISVLSQGPSRNCNATRQYAVIRSGTSLQTTNFSKMQAQHSTALRRVRQVPKAAQWRLRTSSTTAIMFTSWDCVAQREMPSQKQKNSSSQNSAPRGTLKISLMASIWQQSTRKGSIRRNIALRSSASAFSSPSKKRWNRGLSMQPRLTSSLKLSSLSLTVLAWQWSSKMASKKPSLSSHSAQCCSERWKLFLQSMSQENLLTILHPTIFFSIDGSLIMLMPSVTPSNWTRRRRSSPFRFRSSLPQQSTTSSKVSLLASFMISFDGVRKSFSRAQTCPMLSRSTFSFTMWSSIQCSRRRYCPMTPTRIWSNLLSNCARLPMMISMHLLKKPVLKLQTRAQTHSASPSSSVRSAPASSATKRRQSLERKSRIISPQPSGWQWQQKAEQKPQMASSSRLMSASIARARSVAGARTRSRYANTALTVSLNSSQTSFLATASLVRSAVAKYPNVSLRYTARLSVVESPESRFCSRTSLPFIDYPGLSDINPKLLQKIYQQEFRLQGMGRGRGGTSGWNIDDDGSVIEIILANSMPEEGGNRSLTSSDYAQTKFSTFGGTWQGGHNYVPFLNKSSRFGSGGDTAAPPIGTYNLPSCFDRRKSPFEDRISHFLLDSQRAGQQMGVFKSALTRFQQPASSSPGPASYNLFADAQAQRKAPSRADKENTADLARTCPSIPHKGNKYGYAIVNGEMKRIEKSEQQLEKERESRKNYVDTLEGENRLFRESVHRDFHDTDPRRLLFEQTSKFLDHRGEDGHSRSESNLLRKPKYDHLYNSKPVPPSIEHKLIGPGQYEVSGKLTSPARKEKFQFFGSTEVRFKEKGSPQKGYSLLEMIKEGRIVEGGPREKKSPFKKRMANSRCQEGLTANSPGPGEYNPQVQYSKQSRRIAFFPLEQRFKERSALDGQEEAEGEGLHDFGRSRSKKSYNANSLKKERFKPMHQDYQPVRSQQICGIVSESNEGGNGSMKQSPKRVLGKLLKLNSKRGTEGDNQEINSWSRQEGRKKGGYIRELKDELAFISYSPLPEEASKKHTKKLDRKEGE